MNTFKYTNMPNGVMKFSVSEHIVSAFSGKYIEIDEHVKIGLITGANYTTKQEVKIIEHKQENKITRMIIDTVGISDYVNNWSNGSFTFIFASLVGNNLFIYIVNDFVIEYVCVCSPDKHNDKNIYLGTRRTNKIEPMPVPTENIFNLCLLKNGKHLLEMEIGKELTSEQYSFIEHIISEKQRHLSWEILPEPNMIKELLELNTILYLGKEYKSTFEYLEGEYSEEKDFLINYIEESKTCMYSYEREAFRRLFVLLFDEINNKQDVYAILLHLQDFLEDDMIKQKFSDCFVIEDNKVKYLSEKDKKIRQMKKEKKQRDEQDKIVRYVTIQEVEDYYQGTDYKFDNLEQKPEDCLWMKDGKVICIKRVIISIDQYLRGTKIELNGKSYEIAPRDIRMIEDDNVMIQIYVQVPENVKLTREGLYVLLFYPSNFNGFVYPLGEQFDFKVKCNRAYGLFVYINKLKCNEEIVVDFRDGELDVPYEYKDSIDDTTRETWIQWIKDSNMIQNGKKPDEIYEKLSIDDKKDLWQLHTLITKTRLNDVFCTYIGVGKKEIKYHKKVEIIKEDKLSNVRFKRVKILNDDEKYETKTFGHEDTFKAITQNERAILPLAMISTSYLIHNDQYHVFEKITFNEVYAMMLIENIQITKLMSLMVNYKFNSVIDKTNLFKGLFDIFNEKQNTVKNISQPIVDIDTNDRKIKGVEINTNVLPDEIQKKIFENNDLSQTQEEPIQCLQVKSVVEEVNDITPQDKEINIKSQIKTILEPQENKQNKYEISEITVEPYQTKYVNINNVEFCHLPKEFACELTFNEVLNQQIGVSYQDESTGIRNQRFTVSYAKYPTQIVHDQGRQIFLQHDTEEYMLLKVTKILPNNTIVLRIDNQEKVIRKTNQNWYIDNKMLYNYSIFDLLIESGYAKYCPLNVCLMENKGTEFGFDYGTFHDTLETQETIIYRERGKSDIHLFIFHTFHIHNESYDDLYNEIFEKQINVDCKLVKNQHTYYAASEYYILSHPGEFEKKYQSLLKCKSFMKNKDDEWEKTEENMIQGEEISEEDINDTAILNEQLEKQDQFENKEQKERNIKEFEQTNENITEGEVEKLLVEENNDEMDNNNKQIKREQNLKGKDVAKQEEIVKLNGANKKHQEMINRMISDGTLKLSITEQNYWNKFKQYCYVKKIHGNWYFRYSMVKLSAFEVKQFIDEHIGIEWNKNYQLGKHQVYFDITFATNLINNNYCSACTKQEQEMYNSLIHKDFQQITVYDVRSNLLTAYYLGKGQMHGSLNELKEKTPEIFHGQLKEEYEKGKQMSAIETKYYYVNQAKRLLFKLFDDLDMNTSTFYVKQLWAIPQQYVDWAKWEMGLIKPNKKIKKVYKKYWSMKNQMKEYSHGRKTAWKNKNKYVENRYTAQEIKELKEKLHQKIYSLKSKDMYELIKNNVQTLSVMPDTQIDKYDLDARKLNKMNSENEVNIQNKIRDNNTNITPGQRKMIESFDRKFKVYVDDEELKTIKRKTNNHFKNNKTLVYDNEEYDFKLINTILRKCTNYMPLIVLQMFTAVLGFDANYKQQENYTWILLFVGLVCFKKTKNLLLSTILCIFSYFTLWLNTNKIYNFVALASDVIEHKDGVYSFDTNALINKIVNFALWGISIIIISIVLYGLIKIAVKNTITKIVNRKRVKFIKGEKLIPSELLNKTLEKAKNNDITIYADGELPNSYNGKQSTIGDYLITGAPYMSQILTVVALSCTIAFFSNCMMVKVKGAIVPGVLYEYDYNGIHNFTLESINYYYYPSSSCKTAQVYINHNHVERCARLDDWCETDKCNYTSTSIYDNCDIVSTRIVDCFLQYKCVLDTYSYSYDEKEEIGLYNFGYYSISGTKDGEKYHSVVSNSVLINGYYSTDLFTIQNLLFEKQKTINDKGEVLHDISCYDQAPKKPTSFVLIDNDIYGDFKSLCYNKQCSKHNYVNSSLYKTGEVCEKSGAGYMCPPEGSVTISFNNIINLTYTNQTAKLVMVQFMKDDYTNGSKVCVQFDAVYIGEIIIDSISFNYKGSFDCFMTNITKNFVKIVTKYEEKTVLLEDLNVYNKTLYYQEFLKPNTIEIPEEKIPIYIIMAIFAGVVMIIIVVLIIMIIKCIKDKKNKIISKMENLNDKYRSNIYRRIKTEAPGNCLYNCITYDPFRPFSLTDAKGTWYIDLEKHHCREGQLNVEPELADMDIVYEDFCLENPYAISRKDFDDILKRWAVSAILSNYDVSKLLSTLCVDFSPVYGFIEKLIKNKKQNARIIIFPKRKTVYAPPSEIDEECICYQTLAKMIDYSLESLFNLPDYIDDTEHYKVEVAEYNKGWTFEEVSNNCYALPILFNKMSPKTGDMFLVNNLLQTKLCVPSWLFEEAGPTCAVTSPNHVIMWVAKSKKYQEWDNCETPACWINSKCKKDLLPLLEQPLGLESVFNNKKLYLNIGNRHCSSWSAFKNYIKPRYEKKNSSKSTNITKNMKKAENILINNVNFEKPIVQKHFDNNEKIKKCDYYVVKNGIKIQIPTQYIDCFNEICICEKEDDYYIFGRYRGLCTKAPHILFTYSYDYQWMYQNLEVTPKMIIDSKYFADYKNKLKKLNTQLSLDILNMLDDKKEVSTTVFNFKNNQYSTVNKETSEFKVDIKGEEKCIKGAEFKYSEYVCDEKEVKGLNIKRLVPKVGLRDKETNLTRRQKDALYKKLCANSLAKDDDKKTAYRNVKKSEQKVIVTTSNMFYVDRKSRLDTIKFNVTNIPMFVLDICRIYALVNKVDPMPHRTSWSFEVAIKVINERIHLLPELFSTYDLRRFFNLVENELRYKHGFKTSDMRDFISLMLFQKNGEVPLDFEIDLNDVQEAIVPSTYNEVPEAATDRNNIQLMINNIANSETLIIKEGLYVSSEDLTNVNCPNKRAIFKMRAIGTLDIFELENCGCNIFYNDENLLRNHIHELFLPYYELLEPGYVDLYQQKNNGQGACVFNAIFQTDIVIPTENINLMNLACYIYTQYGITVVVNNGSNSMAWGPIKNNKFIFVATNNGHAEAMIPGYVQNQMNVNRCITDSNENHNALTEINNQIRRKYSDMSNDFINSRLIQLNDYVLDGMERHRLVEDDGEVINDAIDLDNLEIQLNNNIFIINDEDEIHQEQQFVVANNIKIIEKVAINAWTAKFLKDVINGCSYGTFNKVNKNKKYFTECGYLCLFTDQMNICRKEILLVSKDQYYVYNKAIIPSTIIDKIIELGDDFDINTLINMNRDENSSEDDNVLDFGQQMNNYLLNINWDDVDLTANINTIMLSIDEALGKEMVGRSLNMADYFYNGQATLHVSYELDWNEAEDYLSHVKYQKNEQNGKQLKRLKENKIDNQEIQVNLICFRISGNVYLRDHKHSFICEKGTYHDGKLYNTSNLYHKTSAFKHKHRNMLYNMNHDALLNMIMNLQLQLYKTTNKWRMIYVKNARILIINSYNYIYCNKVFFRDYIPYSGLQAWYKPTYNGLKNIKHRSQHNIVSKFKYSYFIKNYKFINKMYYVESSYLSYWRDIICVYCYLVGISVELISFDEAMSKSYTNHDLVYFGDCVYYNDWGKRFYDFINKYKTSATNNDEVIIDRPVPINLLGDNGKLLFFEPKRPTLVNHNGENFVTYEIFGFRIRFPRRTENIQPVVQLDNVPRIVCTFNYGYGERTPGFSYTFGDNEIIVEEGDNQWRYNFKNMAQFVNSEFYCKMYHQFVSNTNFYMITNEERFPRKCIIHMNEKCASQTTINMALKAISTPITRCVVASQSSKSGIYESFCVENSKNAYLATMMIQGYDYKTELVGGLEQVLTNMGLKAEASKYLSDYADKTFVINDLAKIFSACNGWLLDKLITSIIVYFTNYSGQEKTILEYVNASLKFMNSNHSLSIMELKLIKIFGQIDSMILSLSTFISKIKSLFKFIFNFLKKWILYAGINPELINQNRNDESYNIPSAIEFYYKISKEDKNDLIRTNTNMSAYENYIRLALCKDNLANVIQNKYRFTKSNIMDWAGSYVEDYDSFIACKNEEIIEYKTLLNNVVNIDEIRNLKHQFDFLRGYKNNNDKTTALTLYNTVDETLFKKGSKYDIRYVVTFAGTINHFYGLRTYDQLKVMGIGEAGFFVFMPNDFYWTNNVVVPDDIETTKYPPIYEPGTKFNIIGTYDVEVLDSNYLLSLGNKLNFTIVELRYMRDHNLIRNYELKRMYAGRRIVSNLIELEECYDHNKKITIQTTDPIHYSIINKVKNLFDQYSVDFLSVDQLLIQGAYISVDCPFTSINPNQVLLRAEKVEDQGIYVLTYKRCEGRELTLFTLQNLVGHTVYRMSDYDMIEKVKQGRCVGQNIYYTKRWDHAEQQWITFNLVLPFLDWDFYRIPYPTIYLINGKSKNPYAKDKRRFVVEDLVFKYNNVFIVDVDNYDFQIYYTDTNKWANITTKYLKEGIFCCNIDCKTSDNQVSFNLKTYVDNIEFPNNPDNYLLLPGAIRYNKWCKHFVSFKTTNCKLFSNGEKIETLSTDKRIMYLVNTYNYLIDNGITSVVLCDNSNNAIIKDYEHGIISDFKYETKINNNIKDGVIGNGKYYVSCMMEGYALLARPLVDKKCCVSITEELWCIDNLIINALVTPYSVGDVVYNQSVIKYKLLLGQDNFDFFVGMIKKNFSLSNDKRTEGTYTDTIVLTKFMPITVNNFFKKIGSNIVKRTKNVIKMFDFTGKKEIMESYEQSYEWKQVNFLEKWKVYNHIILGKNAVQLAKSPTIENRDIKFLDKHIFPYGAIRTFNLVKKALTYSPSVERQYFLDTVMTDLDIFTVIEIVRTCVPLKEMLTNLNDKINFGYCGRVISPEHTKEEVQLVQYILMLKAMMFESWYNLLKTTMCVFRDEIKDDYLKIVDWYENRDVESIMLCYANTTILPCQLLYLVYILLAETNRLKLTKSDEFFPKMSNILSYIIANFQKDDDTLMKMQFKVQLTSTEKEIAGSILSFDDNLDDCAELDTREISELNILAGKMEYIIKNPQSNINHSHYLLQFNRQGRSDVDFANIGQCKNELELDPKKLVVIGQPHIYKQTLNSPRYLSQDKATIHMIELIDLVYSNSISTRLSNTETISDVELLLGTNDTKQEKGFKSIGMIPQNEKPQDNNDEQIVLKQEEISRDQVDNELINRNKKQQQFKKEEEDIMELPKQENNIIMPEPVLPYFNVMPQPLPNQQNIKPFEINTGIDANPLPSLEFPKMEFNPFPHDNSTPMSEYKAIEPMSNKKDIKPIIGDNTLTINIGNQAPSPYSRFFSYKETLKENEMMEEESWYHILEENILPRPTVFGTGKIKGIPIGVDGDTYVLNTTHISFEKEKKFNVIGNMYRIIIEEVPMTLVCFKPLSSLISPEDSTIQIFFKLMGHDPVIIDNAPFFYSVPAYIYDSREFQCIMTRTFLRNLWVDRRNEKYLDKVREALKDRNFPQAVQLMIIQRWNGDNGSNFKIQILHELDDEMIQAHSVLANSSTYNHIPEQSTHGVFKSVMTRLYSNQKVGQIPERFKEILRSCVKIDEDFKIDAIEIIFDNKKPQKLNDILKSLIEGKPVTNNFDIMLKKDEVVLANKKFLARVICPPNNELKTAAIILTTILEEHLIHLNHKGESAFCCGNSGEMNYKLWRRYVDMYFDPIVISLDGASFDSTQYADLQDIIHEKILEILDYEMFSEFDMFRQAFVELFSPKHRLHYLSSNAKKTEGVSVIDLELIGTSVSGHPLKTTYENTVKAEAYAKFLLDCANAEGSVMCCGDDTMIITSRSHLHNILISLPWVYSPFTLGQICKGLIINGMEISIDQIMIIDENGVSIFAPQEIIDDIISQIPNVPTGEFCSCRFSHHGIVKSIGNMLLKNITYSVMPSRLVEESRGMNFSSWLLNSNFVNAIRNVTNINKFRNRNILDQDIFYSSITNDRFIKIDDIAFTKDELLIMNTLHEMEIDHETLIFKKHPNQLFNKLRPMYLRLNDLVFDMFYDLLNTNQKVEAPSLGQDYTLIYDYNYEPLGRSEYNDLKLKFKLEGQRTDFGCYNLEFENEMAQIHIHDMGITGTKIMKLKPYKKFSFFQLVEIMRKEIKQIWGKSLAAEYVPKEYILPEQYDQSIIENPIYAFSFSRPILDIAQDYEEIEMKSFNKRIVEYESDFDANAGIRRLRDRLMLNKALFI